MIAIQAYLPQDEVGKWSIQTERCDGKVVRINITNEFVLPDTNSPIRYVDIWILPDGCASRRDFKYFAFPFTPSSDGAVAMKAVCDAMQEVEKLGARYSSDWLNACIEANQWPVKHPDFPEE